MSERTIVMRMESSGQWKYRIVEGDRVIVDWQYGSYSREETRDQACARFGRSLVDRTEA